MSIQAIMAVLAHSKLGVVPGHDKKPTLYDIAQDQPIGIPLKFTHSHMEDIVFCTMPGGFIPTREEFEDFVDMWRDFYKIVGDEWIDEVNTRIGKRNGSYEPAAPDRRGFVYLARAETGHHKIGVSKKPKKRIKAFDTKMPIKVEMIHSFPCDDAYEAEKMLHELFREKHHDGEWFNLTFVDVDSITEIIRFENGTFEVE